MTWYCIACSLFRSSFKAKQDLASLLFSETAEHEWANALYIVWNTAIQKLNVRYVAQKCSIAFEINLPPTLNPTDGVKKSKCQVKSFAEATMP